MYFSKFLNCIQICNLAKSSGRNPYVDVPGCLKSFPPPKADLFFGHFFYVGFHSMCWNSLSQRPPWLVLAKLALQKLACPFVQGRFGGIQFSKKVDGKELRRQGWHDYCFPFRSPPSLAGAASHPLGGEGTLPKVLGTRPRNSGIKGAGSPKKR